jgi:hypothetical protein
MRSVGADSNKVYGACSVLSLHLHSDYSFVFVDGTLTSNTNKCDIFKY